MADEFNPYVRMASAICELKGRGMSNTVLKSLGDLIAALPLCGYDTFLYELQKYEDQAKVQVQVQTPTEPTSAPAPAPVSASLATNVMPPVPKASDPKVADTEPDNPAEENERSCPSCGQVRNEKDFYPKYRICKHCVALRRVGVDLTDIDKSPAIGTLLKNGFPTSLNETWDIQVIARTLHVQQRTATSVMNSLVEAGIVDRWSARGRQFYFMKPGSEILETQTKVRA